MKRLLTQLQRYTSTPLLHTRPFHRLNIRSSFFARSRSLSKIHTISWSHHADYPNYPAPSPAEEIVSEEENWARMISDQGGVMQDSEFHYVGFVAYRCTYANCSESRWQEFKKVFEKLMLMQWEDQARCGYDPEDNRKCFKVFWVEEREELDGKGITDLGFLRKKFESLIGGQFTDPDLKFVSTAMNVFLLVDDKVISFLLDFTGDKGNIPFVHAVAANAEECEDDWDEDDLELSYQGHYKVAVELLGEFWAIVGSGDMGMEEICLEQHGGGIGRTVGMYALYEDCNSQNVKEKLLE
ncbi:uncharacterized protein LY89DRAFT_737299 [Mollisia scopiformis]|uniref:Uncharacterized protein n=1 Tax=Mollisia scopiformis TaxID=149040 RepID=A0A194WZD9_MOLSC|nr:uncharacterized protein LY89DRAFT_737299 [Mollisia scopiformis]KUJ13321.1 hypothetical protein LY89DRAFT_737299 [Mollisia scopiformis]